MEKKMNKEPVNTESKITLEHIMMIPYMFDIMKILNEGKTTFEELMKDDSVDLTSLRFRLDLLSERGIITETDTEIDYTPHFRAWITKAMPKPRTDLTNEDYERALKGEIPIPEGGIPRKVISLYVKTCPFCNKQYIPKILIYEEAMKSNDLEAREQHLSGCCSTKCWKNSLSTEEN